MAIGKGSLQRAASAVKAAKMSEETQEVKRESGANESEIKGSNGSAENKSGVMWTALIKKEQLCAVPDEWRGPRYVRPNVSMLAESISRCGILEPLPVVRVSGDQYQLVGGSRRMEAIQMLGIAEVPVVVLPGDTMEEARRLYEEMKPYTDAAQDTMHNAKFRTASLFGARRIPEYLL